MRTSHPLQISLFYSCFGLVLAVLLVGTAAAEDWPRWRGENLDARSAEKGLNWEWGEEGPKLLYHVEGFGQGYASVSIVDGVLYTTGNQDDAQTVVAAKAETGEILWKSPITDSNPKHSYEGSRCTPTYDNGKLYVVASSGKIVCLDSKSGSVHWERDFSTWNGKMMSGWGFSESPLIDGDYVICTPGGAEAEIVCLNKNNGEEVWTTSFPEFVEPELESREGKDGAGYSSVVVSNGGGVKQYVQLTGRGVVGVRAADGKFLWGYNQVANEVANIPTPVVKGDYVFATSSYGGGGAVLLKLSSDGDRGAKAEPIYWLAKREFNNHHGGVILQDGYLYGGHNQNQGFPTCIKMESGEIVWGGDGLRGEGKGSAAALYVDGKLIFRYQDGVVVALEATPEDYKVVSKFMPVYQEGKSWAHPVVVDGKLYLREQDHLMCYQLAK